MHRVVHLFSLRGLVIVLPFFWFFCILIAAGLLAHRLHLAARATRQHGGRWRWRWHALVAAHAAQARASDENVRSAPFRSLIPLGPLVFSLCSRIPRALTSLRGSHDAPPRRPMEMALARPRRSCSCLLRGERHFLFSFPVSRFRPLFPLPPLILPFIYRTVTSLGHAGVCPPAPLGDRLLGPQGASCRHPSEHLLQ